MNLFIAEEISEAGGILRSDEAHHAAKVMRLKEGAHILTTTGNGYMYRSEISAILGKELRFVNTAVERQQKPTGLHIAIAPTKNNQRFETFLEKAVEVGVDKITPIITRHSERKQYKVQRGIKVIESACKQSKKALFPTLSAETNFSDFLKVHDAQDLLIAHLEVGVSQSLAELNCGSTATILIGPEGDFHKEEIAAAYEKGAKPVSLGKETLRTETAGIFTAVWWSLARSYQNSGKA